MSMTIDPQQHDTKLAALYFKLAKATQRMAYAKNDIMYAAGFRRHYFGRTRSSEAWAVRGDDGLYERRSFDQAVLALPADHETISNYSMAETHADMISTEIEAAEAEYTGWSRFFLVTSSQGHIHSSMKCSTCFNTTKYGWLPELSGKTEAETVETHGPALCSVCFPSAPVEDTGYKITASKAQELAWSPDRDQKLADRARREIEKAEKKAKKAASKLKYDESLAHKVNYLFDLDVSDVYRWTWDHKGYDNAYNVYSDMTRRAR